MLARRHLPSHHADWNERWGAPFGRGGHLALLADGIGPEQARAIGPFGAQPNSTTRRVEYPWAFHAVPVRPGMRAVEIGGGLTGFQFTLAASGAEVVNVDPLVDYGVQSGDTTVGYRMHDPEETHARMNTWFETDVRLRRCRVSDAGIGTSTVDVVYCLSTLEHLSDEDISACVGEASRILRPGGHLVLTVDLFLDVRPFAPAATNMWGRNVSVRDIAEMSPMQMTAGTPQELCGFREFRPENVLARVEEFDRNEHYPQLAQLVVLRQPA
jgi:2-polyprenyl-3-methyl-5-hydroxy-6-metoxy-1,4-benzoquinol methylase